MSRPKKRIVKRLVMFEISPYDLDGSTLADVLEVFTDIDSKTPGCILEWASGDYEEDGGRFQVVSVQEESDSEYAARVAKEKTKAEKSEARKKITVMNKLRKLQTKMEGLGVKVTIEEIKPEIKRVAVPVSAGPVRKFDFENV